MAKACSEIDCSFCQEKDIKWSRFVCLICPNYELCKKCRDDKRYSEQHRPYHPMQSVLDKGNFFKFMNSIFKPNLRLCCPFCGCWKLTVDDLLQHCQLKHKDDCDPIKCPVCVTFCIPELMENRTWNVPFTMHLETFHREWDQGVTCATCETNPILGNRYVCLICNNYEQCENCYEEKLRSKNHKPYHPIQKILPKDLYAQNLELQPIYRCPFCGDNELSAVGLTEHCCMLHFDDQITDVRCPICTVCTAPFEEHVIQVGSLLDHLRNFHGLLPGAPEPRVADEPIQCIICLLELKTPTVEIYCRCAHNSFHDQCIQNWLAKSPTCPICRAKRLR